MKSNLVQSLLTSFFFALCFGALSNVANAQSSSEIQSLKDECLELDIETYTYAPGTGLKYCERLVQIYHKKAYANNISASQKESYLKEKRKWATEACYSGSANRCYTAALIVGLKEAEGSELLLLACRSDTSFCGVYAKNGDLSDSERARYFFLTCSQTGFYCTDAAAKQYNVVFHPSLGTGGDAESIGIDLLKKGCENLNKNGGDPSTKRFSCQTLGRLMSGNWVNPRYQYLEGELGFNPEEAVEHYIEACKYESRKLGKHSEVEDASMGSDCMQAYYLSDKYDLPIKPAHINPFLPMITKECEQGHGYWSC